MGKSKKKAMHSQMDEQQAEKVMMTMCCHVLLIS